jgi:hypothetical protein
VVRSRENDLNPDLNTDVAASPNNYTVYWNAQGNTIYSLLLFYLLNSLKPGFHMVVKIESHDLSHQPKHNIFMECKELFIS